jgi:hypothetical protein
MQLMRHARDLRDPYSEPPSLLRVGLSNHSASLGSQILDLELLRFLTDHLSVPGPVQALCQMSARLLTVLTAPPRRLCCIAYQILALGTFEGYSRLRLFPRDALSACRAFDDVFFHGHSPFPISALTWTSRRSRLTVLTTLRTPLSSSHARIKAGNVPLLAHQVVHLVLAGDGPFAVDEVKKGEHRVAPRHPWPCVPHDYPDAFTHGRFETVCGAASSF